MPLTDADLDRIESNANDADHLDVRALIAEVRRLRAAIIARTPDPSHVWCGGPLNQCIHCETFAGSPQSLLPCDVSVNAGKEEFCCDCGTEYPRSELIAGHVFCSKCRSAGVPD